MEPVGDDIVVSQYILDRRISGSARDILVHRDAAIIQDSHASAGINLQDECMYLSKYRGRDYPGHP